MTLCDDASTESLSGEDTLDFSSDSSLFKASENDELIDKSEENSSELYNDLYDNSPPNMESLVSKDAENIDDVDSIDTKASLDENKDSIIDSSESESDRKDIYENSEYSDEVNDMISSKEELEIYQKAELKEENINGRTCLVRDDINMEYIDPKSGLTNQELMEKGRAPYDSKTGERIELHHIGQEYDSPFAELTADSEHGQYYSILHTKETESWRVDEQKSNRYNNIDRPQHWKTRVKEH